MIDAQEDKIKPDRVVVSRGGAVLVSRAKADVYWCCTVKADHVVVRLVSHDEGRSHRGGAAVVR